MAGISDDIDEMQVVREDFLNALDEVQPAFGVNEEELQSVVQNGILHYSDHVRVRYWSILAGSRKRMLTRRGADDPTRRHTLCRPGSDKSANTSRFRPAAWYAVHLFCSTTLAHP
jgi:hypothetical protein